MAGYNYKIIVIKMTWEDDGRSGYWESDKTL